MEILVCFIPVFLMLLIYFYAENQLLIVRKYKIKSKKCKTKLKIIQISDIHKKSYPQNWKRLTTRIKEFSPDIILITGDLVSRNTKSLEYTEILIEKLCKICPVYCSAGNHELDLNDEVMEKYRLMMKKNGAFFLENGHEIFQKDDSEIYIYGASLKNTIYKNLNGGYSDLDSLNTEELSQALGNPHSDKLCLLLAHNPFFFETYTEWGADIIFSGHVHGGSVYIPFVGGLLSPERKFFPKYTKGIYTQKQSRMVVSTGIGKPRLFNPSEILFAEIN